MGKRAKLSNCTLLTEEEFNRLPDGTKVIRQAGDFYSVHTVFTQLGEKVINSPAGGFNPYLPLYTLFPGKVYLADEKNTKRFVNYEGVPYGYARH